MLQSILKKAGKVLLLITAVCLMCSCGGGGGGGTGGTSDTGGGGSNTGGGTGGSGGGTYSISGKILGSNNVPVVGAVVTATPSAGKIAEKEVASTGTATTGSDGSFTVSVLTAGSYTLSATLRSAPISIASPVVDVDSDTPAVTISAPFVASQASYLFSGSVKYRDTLLAFPGVSIGMTKTDDNGVPLISSSTHTALTDSNGSFSISVIADGYYKMTVNYTGYEFNNQSIFHIDAASPQKTGINLEGNLPPTGGIGGITTE